MTKVRKITRRPEQGKNYYVIDACFLANWAIPKKYAPPGKEQQIIGQCLEWWREIEAQLASGHARVYMPDICIAETFKTLAKKYYVEDWFPTSAAFQNARKRLHKFVITSTKSLKAAKRSIRFHDVSTTRDIIISVDRFYELFHKRNLPRVSVPDLVIVATAKYLVDFFDIPKTQLHIVTLDRDLWRGSKKIPELPNAYDPTRPEDAAKRIFVTRMPQSERSLFPD